VLRPYSLRNVFLSCYGAEIDLTGFRKTCQVSQMLFFQKAPLWLMTVVAVATYTPPSAS
jgi:hypothetical protein